MLHHRLLLACGLSLVATSAHAVSQEHMTLEEIVVTDTALGNPDATVVDKPSIEKGKNINLPDVLKNEPDIDIKRRTAIGDTADILAIRGFSQNRIMLNIDDRPVNAAGVVGGYYIDWGTIPLDNIEKIEVVKGGSSAEYGNNALGGVINVITRKPTTDPTVNLTATYGTGDIDSMQNYRLTHTNKLGPVGYSLAASYQEADAFLWNNDFEGKNVAGKAFIDMPFSGEMSIGMQYTDAVRGFTLNNRLSVDPDNPNFYKTINSDYPLSFGETFSPYSGKAFDPGPGAEWDKEKYYLDLGYKQPIGEALLEFKAYQNHEDRQEKNYSSSAIVSSYSDGKLVLDRTVESDRSYGGNIKGSYALDYHELQTGIDYKVLAYGDIIVNYIDTVYNGKSYTGGEPSQEGTSWGYYLQDTWAITDSFTLTPGLRYDTYANENVNGSIGRELEDSALTPKLTGTYKLTSTDKMTASLYQAYRTPGLPETYWASNGGLTSSNPDLKPETNNAAELMYQHDFSKKDTIKLSGYYYQVDDYILWRLGNSPATRGTYNIDKVILEGLSADIRHNFTNWMTGRASVTYQKTEKEGSPFAFDSLISGIDNLPTWKANTSLEFKLPYQTVFAANVRYNGESEMVYNYTTGTGSAATYKSKKMDIDAYTTVDLDVKIPIYNHYELAFFVNNLFDVEYEEQFGYPMPGITVGTTVKVSF